MIPWRPLIPTERYVIKIFIVDDHDLVRTGISRMLADVAGLKVVGEAATGEDALKLIRDAAPDVVLMDAKMPGIGGLEAGEALAAGIAAEELVE
mgnify:CR=1 FL=1